MASTRHPFPFPSYETDEKFMGLQSTQKDPYGVPTHLAQRQDPWHRLYGSGTLSSTRREVYHFDPQAPRDSLDFVLKSKYNHHREFLKGTNETLVQKETIGEEHGRILKNKTVHVAPEPLPEGHPMRTVADPKKESFNNLKGLLIEGHHTQTTNRGYSRKPDGGFFTS